MRQDCQDVLNEVLETLIGLEMFLSAFTARTRCHNSDFGDIIGKLAEARRTVRKASSRAKGTVSEAQHLH